MKDKLHFSMRFFPILGIVLGLAAAYLFAHGLFTTWIYIGEHPEGIEKIIGVVGGDRLFVETAAGNLYSLPFYDDSIEDPMSVIPRPLQWQIEEYRAVEPDPSHKPIIHLLSWPLFQRVKQEYVFFRQLVEGDAVEKIALSQNGALWLWHSGAGGMAGVTYFIFPIYGALAGGLIDSILLLARVLNIRKTTLPNHL